MPTYAPLPKRLNVLGISWQVIQSPKRWAVVLEMEKDEPPEDGHTSYDESIISINPELPLERAWVTLLGHEVLHVLEEFAQGHERHCKIREEFIESIDSLLFVFLRDTWGIGLK